MRSGTQGPGDGTCDGAAKCPEALVSLWRGGRGLSQTHVTSTCEAVCLIVKFRLKLKKAGKTTRSLRYDLNQIPYGYTVEVRNRFKGLDLIDRSAWCHTDGGL